MEAWHVLPRGEKIAATIARYLPLAPDEPVLHAHAYALRISRVFHGALRVHFNAIVFPLKFHILGIGNAHWTENVTRRHSDLDRCSKCQCRYY